MAPSEVYNDPIDCEQVQKFKLHEKYAKIKTGKYEPDDDDATEWDLNDLSKNSAIYMEQCDQFWWLFEDPFLGLLEERPQSASTLRFAFIEVYESKTQRQCVTLTATAR